MTSIDTTVRGGFPVTIHGRFLPPSPSVGINYPEVVDFHVTNRRGGSVGFLKLTERELDDLIEELQNAN